MKKLIALCLLMTFIISCSSDDAVTQEELENTVLRPSKISKGDTYWLYEYEDDRVTKIEEYDIDNIMPQEIYEFNYDTANNLISILRNGNDDLRFTFQNGLAIEKNVNPFSWNDSYVNERAYVYDNQNRLIESQNSLWYTDYHSSLWNETYENQYTYDSNNNLSKFERINMPSNSQYDYFLKYIYDDQNHPFKNIDSRVSLFLKLPNEVTPNDTYYDFEIFSDLRQVQSFNNNFTEIRNSNNSVIATFTIIYNEQGYPIELQPGNGIISRRVHIEY
ncbi:hypothetical protein H2O64_11680 [Kordia sp. YSTF-M3]|uniref:DUF4595 domain-containing protein n=1 Tax=Kordia aestuariivivens TaxID=2759037 RepID=A0ABR7Q9V2_9FLAO|nr:hypothetical protein [Kordia aestuariivivens]MBC8755339.1 hypothetical protein [Kordia aestuariivivens]